MRHCSGLILLCVNHNIHTICWACLMYVYIELCCAICENTVADCSHVDCFAIGTSLIPPVGGLKVC